MTGEIVGRSVADAVLKTEHPRGTHQNDIFFPTIGIPEQIALHVGLPQRLLSH